MEKALAIAALRDLARSQLEATLAVAHAAIDEATHPESRPENEYDTRGLEASYLAAGQSERVGELRQLLGYFTSFDTTPNPGAPVGVGTLVAVETDDVIRWRFLAPDGGGMRVEVDGEEIQVITPKSPLGRALLGAEVGEIVEVSEPRPVELAVVETL